MKIFFIIMFLLLSNACFYDSESGWQNNHQSTVVTKPCADYGENACENDGRCRIGINSETNQSRCIEKIKFRLACSQQSVGDCLYFDSCLVVLGRCEERQNQNIGRQEEIVARAARAEAEEVLRDFQFADQDLDPITPINQDRARVRNQTNVKNISHDFDNMSQAKKDALVKDQRFLNEFKRSDVSDKRSGTGVFEEDSSDQGKTRELAVKLINKMTDQEAEIFLDKDTIIKFASCDRVTRFRAKRAREFIRAALEKGVDVIGTSDADENVQLISAQVFIENEIISQPDLSDQELESKLQDMTEIEAKALGQYFFETTPHNRASNNFRVLSTALRVFDQDQKNALADGFFDLLYEQQMGNFVLSGNDFYAGIATRQKKAWFLNDIGLTPRLPFVHQQQFEDDVANYEKSRPIDDGLSQFHVNAENELRQFVANLNDNEEVDGLIFYIAKKASYRKSQDVFKFLREHFNLQEQRKSLLQKLVSVAFAQENIESILSHREDFGIDDFEILESFFGEHEDESIQDLFLKDLKDKMNIPLAFDLNDNDDLQLAEEFSKRLNKFSSALGRSLLYTHPPRNYMSEFIDRDRMLTNALQYEFVHEVETLLGPKESSLRTIRALGITDARHVNSLIHRLYSNGANSGAELKQSLQKIRNYYFSLDPKDQRKIFSVTNDREQRWQFGLDSIDRLLTLPNTKATREIVRRALEAKEKFLYRDNRTDDHSINGVSQNITQWLAKVVYRTQGERPLHLVMKQKNHAGIRGDLQATKQMIADFLEFGANPFLTDGANQNIFVGPYRTTAQNCSDVFVKHYAQSQTGIDQIAGYLLTNASQISVENWILGAVQSNSVIALRKAKTILNQGQWRTLFVDQIDTHLNTGHDHAQERFGEAKTIIGLDALDPIFHDFVGYLEDERANNAI